jgi:CRISPR/Cas system-associated exonuclease Cas4 (RecB family)
MGKNPQHRSVSQMTTYTSCPRKYKFNYLDETTMKDSSAKTLGSALHKAQEFNYRQKIESHIDRPFEEVKDFMNEYLITEFKNNIKNEDFFKVKYGKKETGEEVMKIAGGLLAKLYHEVMVNTQPLFVELPIVININGQEFVMYIDLIDDKWIIRDLKTSASRYAEDVLDRNTQLISYALGFRTKFGRKENGVGLDVAVKTKEPVIQTFRGEISDLQINRFLNSLEQINKAIELELFPPVDNQMTCGWCDFKELCSEDGGLPDAQELAKKLSLIKEIDKKDSDYHATLIKEDISLE